MQEIEIAVVADAGTALRPLPERFADVVNVLDFGADNSGGSDCHAALTAAFARAAALATGSPVAAWFPPGIYAVSQELLLPAWVAMVGDRGATIRATATMAALVGTPAGARHRIGLIEGFLLDGAGLADRGVHLRNFSGFLVRDCEIRNHKTRGIELGAAEAPYSYDFNGQNLWVYRDQEAAAGSAGVYSTNCGDSQMNICQVVGHDVGVDGVWWDSKFSQVHVWSWVPANGMVSRGFRNLGGDAIYDQCQVDGPIGVACYDLAGPRLALIGCAVNNVTLAEGGTHNAAACVAVGSGLEATVVGCRFKGRADAWWARDLGGDLGQVTALGNVTISVTSVAGNLIASNVKRNGPAGTIRSLELLSAGVLRWRFGTNAAAEAGANAGSDLLLGRMDDAGGYLSTPFCVSRKTGNIGFNTTVPNNLIRAYVNGGLAIHPGASVVPENNGDVAFELTANTTLTLKARGSDGVVRSAVLTLA